MRIIGIDPGAIGAIVTLERDMPIEWEMMPTMKVGSATRVNAAALAEIIKRSPGAEVFLESVHSMPGQGVSSTFNFGHSCGTIAGVLGALNVRVTLVQPQAWKKRAGLIGTDKDASRARAIQYWPEWRELDKKGRGQAYADAAFIAVFGEIKNSG